MIVELSFVDISSTTGSWMMQSSLLFAAYESQGMMLSLFTLLIASSRFVLTADWIDFFNIIVNDEMWVLAKGIVKTLSGTLSFSNNWNNSSNLDCSLFHLSSVHFECTYSFGLNSSFWFTVDSKSINPLLDSLLTKSKHSRATILLWLWSDHNISLAPNGSHFFQQFAFSISSSKIRVVYC